MIERNYFNFNFKFFKNIHSIRLNIDNHHHCSFHFLYFSTLSYRRSNNQWIIEKKKKTFSRSSLILTTQLRKQVSRFFPSFVSIVRNNYFYIFLRPFLETFVSVKKHTTWCFVLYNVPCSVSTEISELKQSCARTWYVESPFYDWSDRVNSLKSSLTSTFVQ